LDKAQRALSGLGGALELSAGRIRKFTVESKLKNIRIRWLDYGIPLALALGAFAVGVWKAIIIWKAL
jgi:hypothetical protein